MDEKGQRRKQENSGTGGREYGGIFTELESQGETDEDIPGLSDAGTYHQLCGADRYDLL